MTKEKAKQIKQKIKHENTHSNYYKKQPLE